MGELIAVWVFFYWLSAGVPDNVAGPFRTEAECVEAYRKAPPEVLATSGCFEVKPALRSGKTT